MQTSSSALRRLADELVACRRCPRLVRHREAAGANPPKRYRGQTYWSRPLPGFGDPIARVLLVGLAPAANGGNRTGRMFTGDESGNWLFEALHAAGFASQPTSVTRDDGLTLKDAWITAALRCAPPLNKPEREELARCQPFLLRELRALTQVRVVVALGRIGWENYLKARKALGWPKSIGRPIFGHGAMTHFEDGTVLLSSYHPSQQNTFTGKLTKPMLRSIFDQARTLMDHGPIERPVSEPARAKRDAESPPPLARAKRSAAAMPSLAPAKRSAARVGTPPKRRPPLS